MFSEDSDSDFFILLFITIGILCLFITTIISLLHVLQKRYQRAQQEKRDMEQNYQNELLKARLEIQEQTFTYLSEEIHDNIGQSLSLVKLNLNMGSKIQLEQAKDILSTSIRDLRNLTQNLHTESLRNKGLAKAIKDELKRVQQTRLYDVTMDISGDGALESEKSILIFRIFQESLNNILKHAKAKKIHVKLLFHARQVTLELLDDGVGFDTGGRYAGLGLMNMHKRAAMSGGELQLFSKPGEGCRINLTIDLSDRNEDNAPHKHSTG